MLDTAPDCRASHQAGNQVAILGVVVVGRISPSPVGLYVAPFTEGADADPHPTARYVLRPDFRVAIPAPCAVVSLVPLTPPGFFVIVARSDPLWLMGDCLWREGEAEYEDCEPSEHGSSNHPCPTFVITVRNFVLSSMKKYGGEGWAPSPYGFTDRGRNRRQADPSGCPGCCRRRSSPRRAASTACRDGRASPLPRASRCRRG